MNDSWGQLQYTPLVRNPYPPFKKHLAISTTQVFIPCTLLGFKNHCPLLYRKLDAQLISTKSSFNNMTILNAVLINCIKPVYQSML